MVRAAAFNTRFNLEDGGCMLTQSSEYDSATVTM